MTVLADRLQNNAKIVVIWSIERAHERIKDVVKDK